MTSLHILLEARSAVRRCWRAYEIEVGADLFGAWLVEMSYGRIGTMGRSKIRSFATAADAQAEVNGCLRKRASAPRRIGVAYRLRRASQAADWSQPGLDDRLYVWFGGAGWADHPNLALSQVQIGGTQPLMSNSLSGRIIGWPDGIWSLRVRPIGHLGRPHRAGFSAATSATPPG